MGLEASLIKQYSQLITAAKRAKRKKLQYQHPDYVYYEEHHIYPTCLVVFDTGDENATDNRKQNKALLTFEEHVKAHILLARLYPGHFGLQQTPDYMLRLDGRIVAVEVAAKAKELAANSTGDRNKQWHSEGRHPMQDPKNQEAQSIRNSARLLKASKAGEHQWQTDEHRDACSARATERNLAESAAGTNPFQRLGESHSSNKPENRLAKSESLKELMQCPHCCTIACRGTMQIWHFDNCKLLSSIGATCDISESDEYLRCPDCDYLSKRRSAMTNHRNKHCTGTKHDT